MAAKKKPQPVVISRAAWERLTEAFDTHLSALRANELSSAKRAIKDGDLAEATQSLSRADALDTFALELNDIAVEEHGIRIE